MTHRPAPGPSRFETASIRRLGAVVASLALLFALRAAAAGAAEATTGTLAGAVTDAAFASVAGARVDAAAPSGRASTVTDATGRFTLLGLQPDTYAVAIAARGYEPATLHVTVEAGRTVRLAAVLQKALATLALVRPRSAFTAGGTSDSYVVSGDAARALAPTTASAGLGSYTQGTVQGAIANVPGVDLDPFANAIIRGGKVSDAVFDYDSIPIPQGLIAEPGGNIDGAQLPTTGVASTTTTLAGYTNESSNALGGVIDQIAAVGTSPGRATLELGDGLGTRFQFVDVQVLGASPDLRLRYAVAARSGSQYLPYGDGRTFYPSEAATYGIALQDKSQYSLEANLHYRVGAADDVSVLGIGGQARYDQYGSPYPGETFGAFDSSSPAQVARYPGETSAAAPVHFASGVDGSYDAYKLQYVHPGGRLLSRAQLYSSEFGSSAGGPFWDENGFPNGAISLFQTSAQRQTGVDYDGDGTFGKQRLRFGAEYRSTTSLLDQVVPTAAEFVTSRPTLHSYLGYLSDTYTASNRLEIAATLRATGTHIAPSTGFAYAAGGLDPHFALAYRIGGGAALLATFDHTTVAPAPLEADRNDSANVDASGNRAPFRPLAAETANDFTYSFETNGSTQVRATYYQEFEKNLVDVLPFNFRSARAAGLSPTGVGVPTNVGNLRANGFEVALKRGAFNLQGNLVRAFSSSASQFAYNDLNAPAVALGHLFPVSYEPDFTAEASYEFRAGSRLRITPSLSYQTGYPYGNGRDVYIFDPVSGRPERVPNDNYVDPGFSYYFLRDPAKPYDAVSNPYVGTLGTPEGGDPNTLRSPSQVLANLHVEGDIGARATLILDVQNVFGEFAPTAYQGNPYLIGPPGYAGGNPLYGAAYQSAAGFAAPYVLGNGVPTNDGVHQSVPWTYGRAGYVAQSYPLGRTVELRLRYRL